MRHGTAKRKQIILSSSNKAEEGGKKEAAEATGGCKRLACYFCSDITAPRDSTRDRTLDQQCTVTRPGLAPMAAAAAVELLVSLLHHPERGAAPAPKQVAAAKSAVATARKKEEGRAAAPSGETILGALPHQVRGYVASFETLTLFAEQFPACCACSPRIVAEYRKRGLDFLRDVFDSPDSHALLERVSGAAEMVKAMEEMDDLDFDFPSDDEWGE